MYAKEVLASSANKFLMLLSSHLTALKNHLLKAQLKTLYLLSLQMILCMFNSHQWIHFVLLHLFFRQEEIQSLLIDNLRFTRWWLWKCTISSLTNIVNCYLSDLRIWAPNLKVWGSILHKDSNFLLAPHLWKDEKNFLNYFHQAQNLPSFLLIIFVKWILKFWN